MPGILEIYAQEYYINEHEDDVGGGLVGSMPVEPIAPEYITEEIVGDIFIKPKMSYTYIYEGTRDGNWLWDQKYPIKLISSAEENGKQIITIKWNTTQSGQFVLAFGNSMENAIKKTVVVESLF